MVFSNLKYTYWLHSWVCVSFLWSFFVDEVQQSQFFRCWCLCKFPLSVQGHLWVLLHWPAAKKKREKKNFNKETIQNVDVAILFHTFIYTNIFNSFIFFFLFLWDHHNKETLKKNLGNCCWESYGKIMHHFSIFSFSKKCSWTYTNILHSKQIVYGR